jgi:pyruvate,orthophosphate dikinase
MPEGVYLIGCPGKSSSGEAASVGSMGFKAWNLLRMEQLALPVPPAFVLGTRHCPQPAGPAQRLDPGLWHAPLRALERASGLLFGDARRPLLLSVRSGAPVSMPGMMATLLNIGLCDATVGGVLRQTGNPRLVWDAYRRLVAAYAEDVAGLPAEIFEAEVATLAGGADERELDFAQLRELTRRFLDRYARAAERPFPQDPGEQLAGAIGAVFSSWQSPKAREYRRLNGIPDTLGTAVTVQQMIFGNAGGRSGAGVGFTRDPATGAPALWADFLFNAQGEDVVSGRRTVVPGKDGLATVLPTVWQALQDAAARLERGFADMQDFEFTVEDGRLFLLQTRSGKRTPVAAARIALDMLDEGLIGPDVARERTAGLDRAALAQTRIVAPSGAPLVPLAHAASASGGVAVGEIALDEARAVARQQAGASCVLVRGDAETGDLRALEAAVGLLTRRGARTSHAAVVARQLGKVCLVGCRELSIDEPARTIRIGDTTLREGDLLTLDGNDGVVYPGRVQAEVEYPDELLARLAALRQ